MSENNEGRHDMPKKMSEIGLMKHRSEPSELADTAGSAKSAMDETIMYAAMHAAALADMDSENAPYPEGDLVELWLSQNGMAHIVRSTVRELHRQGRNFS